MSIFAFFSKTNNTVVTKGMYIIGARYPITTLEFQWPKTSGSLFMIRNKVPLWCTSFLIIYTEPPVFSHWNFSVEIGFLAPIIYITFVTNVLLFFEKNAKIVTNLPQGCSTPLIECVIFYRQVAKQYAGAPYQMRNKVNATIWPWSLIPNSAVMLVACRKLHI